MCDRFSMFPHQLLRAGLSRHELLVLLCLLSYRNGDGQAWPYRATIAEDTGINVRHVHSAVKSLAKKGMIAMDTQAGVRTVYTFPSLDGAAMPAIAENHTARHLDMVAPEHDSVIAENATTATDDNLSHVAEPPIVLPVVEHETHESAPQAALQVIDAPQTTVVQGELLPVPTKQIGRIKSAAVQGELLPASPKKRRGRPKTDGHRIPDDWYLTRKLGMWAKEKYGIGDDAIRFETDKFIDHWKASANENAWKSDWDAAWRNWIRKYAESGGATKGAPQKKSKTLQAIEALTGKSGLDFEIPF